MQDRLTRAWAHSEDVPVPEIRRPSWSSCARTGTAAPVPRAPAAPVVGARMQRPTATCPGADLLRLPPHTASRSQHGGRCSVERPTLPRTRRTDIYACTQERTRTFYSTIDPCIDCT